MMRTTTPILSILIAVLLFIFFTHPEYLKTAKITEEISQYQEAKDTYAQFSGELEAKLTKKAMRSASLIESLNRLVPDEIDETRHLVDLETLAKQHNMLFGNVAVEGKNAPVTKRGEKAPAPSGELTAVDISFELVGTYAQFKAFLGDLERSLTVFEVTGLSFNVIEGPFQQFALTVRTYALPGANE